MHKVKIISEIPALLILFFFIFSCNPEKNIQPSEFNLRFSTDTIMFDTVFTGIGTTTRRFTVFNPNHGTVEVKSVRLGKIPNTNFFINVDGIQGPEVRNVRIRAKDSIYVFVEANIDPNRDKMVEQDSIIFELETARAAVIIIAFGQDVVLLNQTLLQTQTLSNQKPYLVYNYAIVDKDHTVTVPEGVRFYFHYRSSLIVNGTLRVEGTVDAPVIFRSDRLEPFYSDKPGQWGAWITLDNGGIYLLGGIHFTTSSRNNRIHYAIIENAIKGIQIDSVIGGSEPGLRITNTIIRHHNLAGIVAQTSSIEAHNLVIHNCGSYALALLLGGDYWFNHTTIANYTPFTSRSTPAVYINNYYTYNGQAYAFPLVRCLFSNSIIHGFYSTSRAEVGFDLVSGPTIHYLFDHCILIPGNNIDTSDNTHFRNIIVAKQGVGFKDIGKYNFDLDTLSAAKDCGLPDYAVFAPTDIKGRSRFSDQKPDIGAYERLE